MTSTLPRRALFRTAGALGAATALPAGAEAQAPPGHDAAKRFSGPAPTPVYRFFNPAEAAFVEAATDRLIPADDEWPGAVWAGVPGYIDQQLAGAYGQGARLYAAGPWQQGTPSQGYQLALNPSQLYRTSLAVIGRELGTRGLDFGRAPGEQKDAFLKELEDGKVDIGGFPSNIFFETLLANTIEGFLSDPSYGGNREMVGWRMIGFPGAYAAYLDTYTNHGMRFEREPIAMGAHSHQHGRAGEERRHG